MCPFYWIIWKTWPIDSDKEREAVYHICGRTCASSSKWKFALLTSGLRQIPPKFYVKSICAIDVLNSSLNPFPKVVSAQRSCQIVGHKSDIFSDILTNELRIRYFKEPNYRSFQDNETKASAVQYRRRCESILGPHLN